MEAAYWHAVGCPPPYESSFTPLTTQIQPRHLEIVHTDIPQLTASDQVLIKGKKKNICIWYGIDKMNVYPGFKKSPIPGSVAPIIMSPRLVCAISLG